MPGRRDDLDHAADPDGWARGGRGRPHRIPGAVTSDLVEITLLSLAVSGAATLISLLIGLPIGTWLALSAVPLAPRRAERRQHRHGAAAGGRRPVRRDVLWRSGTLGGLGLMYTPGAMVIAEVVIAAPVVIGLTVAGLGQLDPRLQLQLLGLGASRWQTVWWLWREARLPLLAAVMAAFGSVISEVGAAMMVGGNIAHETRVLTTSIVLETGAASSGTPSSWASSCWPWRSWSTAC